VERDNVFSLQDYLAVLRRQRGMIVWVAVLATVAGLAWFLVQTPMYEARAELTLDRVRATQDVSLNELLNPSANVQDQDVSAATSPAVADLAADELGRGDPSRLLEQVRAEAVADNRILRVTASDPDPAAAAEIADAFATAFVEYRREQAIETVLSTRAELEERAEDLRAQISDVETELAALGFDANVTPELDPETGEPVEVPSPALTDEEAEDVETLQIRRNALRSQLSQVIARSTELGESADALTGFAADLNRAQVPTEPVGTDIFSAGGVSLILGLALGIALAFVRDHFDDVIRDEDDFKRATNRLPVLGRIPLWKPTVGDTERLASIMEPSSSAAEAYRELSAGVRFLLVARDDEPKHEASEHHGLTRSRVVLICSATMGEGKTATAGNLAVAAARVGLRTVLVDADLRRPAVSQRFGIGRTTGLSDALLNGEDPKLHTLDVGIDNLSILSAGTIPPNPAELLASPAMRVLQQRLLEDHDLVVFDTPAVLAVPDALELGPYADLAVLVGRVGSTSRRRIAAALERLVQVGTDVSGTVLNGVGPGAGDYYYAYYYREPDAAEESSSDNVRPSRQATRSAKHARRRRHDEPVAVKQPKVKQPKVKQPKEEAGPRRSESGAVTIRLRDDTAPGPDGQREDRDEQGRLLWSKDKRS